MSQDSVERFLGRIITDEDFRECARNSLPEACVKGGYLLTHHEIEILRILNFEQFVLVSKMIDKRIKRCGSSSGLL